MEPVEQYKKKTNTGDAVIIRILQPSAPPAPTVVLIGWVGASMKNVTKYATIYETMGYNTVKLVTPPSVIFAMRPVTSAKFLLSVLRILAADHRLTAGGLVFHKFSNGGATVSPHLSDFFAGNYSHIVKADDQIVVNKCKHAIAAVVFDSAPCYMHVDAGASALTHALRIPPGIICNLVFTLFALFAWVQRVFVMDIPVVFWKGVTHARYLCPEQYIFSTVDPLLDSDALDALIERRQREGVDARVFRVQDADHVLILRKHPDKYVEVIRALNDWGINAWRKRNNAQPWQLPPDPSAQQPTEAELSKI